MSAGNAVAPLTADPEDSRSRLQIRLLHYGAALLGIAVATLLRYGLTPLVGDAFPYATFVLTVMILAYYVGMGPALLATVLGALAGVYFFLPPHFSLRIHNPTDAMSIGVYGFICVSITGLIESLRKSQAHAKRSAQEAQRQREQMEQQVRQREEAEARLRAKQEQVEALNGRLQGMMRETQDRVRNNLQVITALAEIQVTGEETVPATAMQRIGQHGQVLAVIHEMVSRSALRPEEARCLSLPELMAKLQLLARNLIGPRPLRMQVSEGSLTIDQAMALSLLINELISNAVLHGQGEIALRLSLENERVHLEVLDEGPGFSAGFDPARDGRTGLQLIENYARWDLQGQVAYGNRPGGGACVRVDFPLSLPAAKPAPPLDLAHPDEDTLRF